MECREGLPPTPPKVALEAPQAEPAAAGPASGTAPPRLLDAAAKPAAVLAAAGGTALELASGAAGQKDKGQPRKPLGKLDNHASGGRGSGRGSVLRPR